MPAKAIKTTMNSSYCITVSQLNNYIDNLLFSDSFLSKISIRGEVVELNAKYNNIFLTLKDSASSIDCIITDALNIKNLDQLEQGIEIIASGYASFYTKTGKFRFCIRSFELFGNGIYLKELEELKNKLYKDGVFDADRKKTIPAYPDHIGIITSKSGAALHDILNIASRRNDTIKLSLYPVKVQGETAASEMINAIKYYNGFTDADVIILGRGGGGAIDLSPFNDEGLVRQVAASGIPIISAVGHEIDYSLCDLAADLRAPTPSAAAELAVPAKKDIEELINSLLTENKYILSEKINNAENTVKNFKNMISSDALTGKIDRFTENINFYKNSEYDILVNRFNMTQSFLDAYTSSLELLCPDETFKRGYSAVKKDGKYIMSAKDLNIADDIIIKFHDGDIKAKVTKEVENGK